MRSTLIVWYCIVLHACYGAGVLIDPGVAKIAALGSTSSLIGTYPTGFAMLAIAGLAAIGLLWHREGSLRGLLGVAWQQMFLIAGAVSAVHSAVVGHYPDGTVKPWLFIAVDQSPAVLIAAAHTWQIAGLFLSRPPTLPRECSLKGCPILQQMRTDAR